MNLLLPKEPRYIPLWRSATALTVCIVLFLGLIAGPWIWSMLIQTNAEDSLKMINSNGGLLTLLGVAIYTLTVRWIDNAASNLEVLRPGTPVSWLRLIPIIAFIPVLNLFASFIYYSYLWQKSDPDVDQTRANFYFQPMIYLRCGLIILVAYLLVGDIDNPPTDEGRSAYGLYSAVDNLLLIAILHLSIVFEITNLQKKLYLDTQHEPSTNICKKCGEDYPPDLHHCPVCGAPPVVENRS